MRLRRRTTGSPLQTHGPARKRDNAISEREMNTEKWARMTDTVGETTDELALQITSKLGDAVKIGKEAFYKQSEMSLKDAYDYTGVVMAENMMFEQTKKGINLFLDKKTPEWDQ